MVICIDFDGTCVTHDFPNVGGDIGAVPVLKELIKNGHKLILWTMRSNIDNPTSDTNESGELHLQSGEYLTEALQWFINNDIELYGVQRNPNQDNWTNSPKAYANLYIDDAALGCPLKHNLSFSLRPYADWEVIRKYLVDNKIIAEKKTKYKK